MHILCMSEKMSIKYQIKLLECFTQMFSTCFEHLSNSTMEQQQKKSTNITKNLTEQR